MKFCFVLMPFGKKADGNLTIDFDEVYRLIIKPAVEEAGLEPIRADEEKVGGIIHKPMFERLLLCDFAIADLTFSNANVFYELGVRHTHKKHTTIIMFAQATRLPFDVSFLRGMAYSVGPKGELLDITSDMKNLVAKILHAKQNRETDSPLYQLLEDYPDIAHTKADVFREKVQYSINLKDRLGAIREQYKSDNDLILKNLIEFQNSLDNLDNVESGVLIDLMLSYRGCGTAAAYDEMVKLIHKMPDPLQQTVMVIEQKALALNRLKKDLEAENILLSLIEEKGPSSETYGILGRVYKDRWSNAKVEGDTIKAKGALKRAINAYKLGFQSDIRDAYPGINAVTLMFVANPQDNELKDLLPVVKYAVKRKLEHRNPDYWDYATLFELAVVEHNLNEAEEYLEQMVSFEDNEKFMYDTTIGNLEILRESGAFVNESLERLRGLTEYLEKKAASQQP